MSPMPLFDQLPRVAAAAADPRPISGPPPPPPAASPSYLDAIRWVQVFNDSGEDVPGGALLRPTGSDADGVVKVAKPTAGSQTGLLIAHPTGIPIGQFGLATADDLVPAYYDPALTPAARDTLGAKASSWWLTSAETGYLVTADPNGQGLVEVVRAPVGGEEFDAEITGNNAGTPVLYSWKKVYLSSGGTWTDASPSVTGANTLYRAPSNTPAHPPTPTPPVIPNGQVVRIKPAPSKPGYYETDAVGGLTEVAMKNAACADGYLGGRDLYFTATSPPPPPATPAWYCVPDGSGGQVCVSYTTTPPQHPFGGPYPTQSACQAAC